MSIQLRHSDTVEEVWIVTQVLWKKASHFSHLSLKKGALIFFSNPNDAMLLHPLFPLLIKCSKSLVHTVVVPTVPAQPWGQTPLAGLSPG